MQPAGCIYKTMGKGSQKAPRSRVKHLKYAGITQKTLDSYRKQVRLFFEYLHVHRICMPSSLDELDAEASEYVNHMYQEGEPHGYATTFVSGLKRLYPKCRKRLDIATQFCKHWTKTLRRKRAMPLPANVVVGMAGLAYAFGEPRVGISLLVGFLGLLRTGELLSLTVGHIKIASPRLCIVSLPGSKGSHQKGFDETVLLHDPVVVGLLRNVVTHLRPDERLFPGSFRDLDRAIRRYAAYFGIEGRSLTPYCLRRGGATWHFSKYASMDATQALGRWEHASTAKGYINQAVSDSVAVSLDVAGRARAERCARVLSRLACSSPSRP